MPDQAEVAATDFQMPVQRRAVARSSTGVPVVAALLQAPVWPASTPT
ncbi:hypothetical protein AB0O75_09230 [Streptomyces sp. NPDC088921]